MVEKDPYKIVAEKYSKTPIKTEEDVVNFYGKQILLLEPEDVRKTLSLLTAILTGEEIPKGLESSKFTKNP